MLNYIPYRIRPTLVTPLCIAEKLAWQAKITDVKRGVFHN